MYLNLLLIGQLGGRQTPLTNQCQARQNFLCCRQLITIFIALTVSNKIIALYSNKLALQKQALRGVLRKSCSEDMQQIYKRTPMPEYDFNKIALQVY